MSWWMLLWEPLLQKGVDLNVDKDLGYAKHHASSLFSFLLENSLYYWC